MYMIFLGCNFVDGNVCVWLKVPTSSARRKIGSQYICQAIEKFCFDILRQTALLLLLTGPNDLAAVTTLPRQGKTFDFVLLYHTIRMMRYIKTNIFQTFIVLIIR